MARTIDQVGRRQVRVRAAAVGVKMKINAEVGPRDGVPACVVGHRAMLYFGGVFASVIFFM
jgi:hypothetical protein